MKRPTDDSFLWSAWKQTFVLILHPGVIIPAAFSVVFIWLSVFHNSSSSTTVIFSALASVSAGVGGGFAVDIYREQSGNTTLIKKGRSAVRNLDLISSQLNRIRDRLDSGGRGKSRIELQEVSHHLVTTEDNIVSGIEDWVDLVPELKEISQINRQIAQKDLKIRELAKEKDVLSKIKQQDRAEKEAEVKKKDQEIDRLRSEIFSLRSKSYTLGGGTLTPAISGVQSGSPFVGSVGSRICRNCGRNYIGSLNDINNLCPSCTALGLTAL